MKSNSQKHLIINSNNQKDKKNKGNAKNEKVKIKTTIHEIEACKVEVDT